MNCNLDVWFFYLQIPEVAESILKPKKVQWSIVTGPVLANSRLFWDNEMKTHLRCSITDNNVDFRKRTTNCRGNNMIPTDNCTSTRFAGHADKPWMTIGLHICSSNDSRFCVTASSHCRTTNRASLGEKSLLKLLNVKNDRLFLISYSTQIIRSYSLFFSTRFLGISWLVCCMSPILHSLGLTKVSISLMAAILTTKVL